MPVYSTEIGVALQDNKSELLEPFPIKSFVDLFGALPAEYEPLIGLLSDTELTAETLANTLEVAASLVKSKVFVVFNLKADRMTIIHDSDYWRMLTAFPIVIRDDGIYLMRPTDAFNKFFTVCANVDAVVKAFYNDFCGFNHLNKEHYQLMCDLSHASIPN